MPPVFCSEFAAAVQLTICVQLTFEAVAEMFTAAMNISEREPSACEGKIEKRPSRETSLAGKFLERVESNRSNASSSCAIAFMPRESPVLSSCTASDCCSVRYRQTL